MLWFQLFSIFVQLFFKTIPKKPIENNYNMLLENTLFLEQDFRKLFFVKNYQMRF